MIIPKGVFRMVRLLAYRAFLFCIGTGINAVPELCMRFRGDKVVTHDMITISISVPTDAGSFRCAYVPLARCLPLLMRRQRR